MKSLLCFDPLKVKNRECPNAGALLICRMFSSQLGQVSPVAVTPQWVKVTPLCSWETALVHLSPSQKRIQIGKPPSRGLVLKKMGHGTTDRPSRHLLAACGLASTGLSRQQGPSKCERLGARAQQSGADIPGQKAPQKAVIHPNNMRRVSLRLWAKQLLEVRTRR